MEGLVLEKSEKNKELASFKPNFWQVYIQMNMIKK